MNHRKISEAAGPEDDPNFSPAWWNVAVWALAAGAFATALVLSYRQIHYNIPNDLRSPAILLVNALLATLVAVGFALRESSLPRWADAHLCLRFGLWAAAVFRLVPPIMNEDILFLKGGMTFDLPYVLFGAVVHGVLALVLASPYAIRVLDIPIGTDNDVLLELCGSAVLVFLVVACVVRLLADRSLLGLG
jgi:hypothetical protein